MIVAGCERGGDLLAPTHADRGPAGQGERDITANTGGQFGQFRLAQARAPQLVTGDQGGGRVGAAAGQAGCDRNALADADGQPGHLAAGRAAHLRDGPGGEDRQVAVVGRDLAGSFAGDRHAVPGRRADRHLVEQGDRVEHCHQVVVAVCPDRANGQLQVHLRRHAHGNSGHGAHDVPMVAVRTAARSSRRQVTARSYHGYSALRVTAGQRRGARWGEA